jgi:hypothetical protein
MDWVRDTLRHGLGADGVKELMVKPYRRIVVLHITILAGGFALQALGQPIVGLMILVLVKTGSDVWHWRREDVAEVDTPDETAAIEEEIAKIAEEYARPVVTVNGQEKEFGSFREMKASKEFRMAMAVMRFMGASKEMKILTTYLDRRIAAESDRAAKTDSIESAA